MADQLLKFKPITSDDVYKGLDKSYGAIQVVSGSDLRWWYVDREDVTTSTSTDDMKNLFHSFGIAREDQDDWFKVFNVTDWYNAKRMIIITLPQSGITSMIDGSTLEVNVPSGITSTSFVKLYGSTFESFPDPVNDQQIAMEYADSHHGGAYCYLYPNSYGANGFADSLGEHPYTGNVNGAVNPNAGESSWDVDTANVVPHLSAQHWDDGGDDGHDIPYGVALLDRGIFVIFDMYGRDDLVGPHLSATTIWNAQATTVFGAVTYTGGTIESNVNAVTNYKAVAFTGTAVATTANVSYRTVDQAYKMVYFCHAGQNEFNSTSNHTYNQKKAYFRPDESDSLWVTEVGLYDDNDDLLAYGKLSEPVEKNKLETMTFKVELQL